MVSLKKTPCLSKALLIESNNVAPSELGQSNCHLYYKHKPECDNIVLTRIKIEKAVIIVIVSEPVEVIVVVDAFD